MDRGNRLTALHFALLMALGGTLLASGCADNSGPRLAPVTGRVTLNGQPVEGALVIFQPAGQSYSSGVTQADGSYKLDYNVRKQGAIVGEHRVSIRPNPSGGGSKLAEQIPKAYYDNSDLSANVQSGDNVFDFQLAK